MQHNKPFMYRSYSNSNKHPYDYINEKAVNKSLLCSSCGRPFVDPVVADDGRYGCKLCFEGVVDSMQPVKEFLILAMLNAIEVRCPGCGAEDITRGQLAQHERETCSQANVSCSAADIKCPWRGTRATLDEHEKVCVFEPLRSALKELIDENEKLKERVKKLEQANQ